MKIGQYINFIFFQRHVDPRIPEYDPFDTFAGQVEFVKRHNIPATFLLQYDVLCDDRYIRLLKNGELNSEIGGWFEIVKELTEDAGIKWRGREGFSWDWHADVGFSVGYTPSERRKLVDTYMKKYFAVFGEYPESFGSWIIDAYTLEYMHKTYGVKASCNCRDQWGTDGYTLWGGYYGNAYYPSKNNVFCPAADKEDQIDVPVFRMLGSDPIHQYDIGLESDENGNLVPTELQGVATMEPYYTDTAGGGVPSWVDWYLRETYCDEGLGLHYTQVGQENSFPWDTVKDGLEYQVKEIKKMAAEGKVQLVTLAEAAKAYRKAYGLTPATVLSAMSDWDEKRQRKSIWYLSRYYRLNFYSEKKRFWLRDMFLFNEAYKERYLKETCKSHAFIYDNLPVIDGNRQSGGRVRAGIYFSAPCGKEPILADMSAAYSENGVMLVTVKDTDGYEYTLKCSGSAVEFGGPAGFSLEFKAGQAADFSELTERDMKLEYNGFKYALRLEKGAFEKESALSCRVLSENGAIAFSLGR